MSIIHRLATIYAESPWTHVTLSVPMLETFLLLALLTLCMLLRFPKIGLLIAYLFVYRWGWICCRTEMGITGKFLAAYIAFGIIVAALVVIGMIQESMRPAS